MSIQKQTLRANNKALAQSLAKVKLELRQVNSQNMELLSQNQDMQLELMRLKRVAGLKDNEIDNEVQLRVQVKYRKNSKIWDTSNNCHNCPKNRKVSCNIALIHPKDAD